MINKPNILTDSHGRHHNYLRISLTEKCNLRCTYCMPASGVPLTPSAKLMNASEIFEIANEFVTNGVNKIRLTGGEPLVRKDFSEILSKLSILNTTLSITTNAIIVERFIDDLKSASVKTVNVSLDTLQKERFIQMTLKDQFEKVMSNILLLLENNFKVKINVVLLRGVNDSEIIDFISLTKHLPVVIRFIEFMPFDGNKWDRSKAVGLKEIEESISKVFSPHEVQRIHDAPNDTAKNFKIKGYLGSYAVISTVTNPFCDSCNRLRLTADGKIRNCLFSENESDLLTELRKGKPIGPIINAAVKKKFAVRAGLDTEEKFQDPNNHNNRSMIRIGG